MMMILSFAAILGLAIGGTMLITPDTLYRINEHIITLFYKLIEYINKILLKFGRYLNKTCFSSQGDFACRLAIASFSIFVGLCMAYIVYYYSEHNELPPIVNNLILSFWNLVPKQQN